LQSNTTRNVNKPQKNGSSKIVVKEATRILVKPQAQPFKAPSADSGAQSHTMSQNRKVAATSPWPREIEAAIRRQQLQSGVAKAAAVCVNDKRTSAADTKSDVANSAADQKLRMSLKKEYSSSLRRHGFDPFAIKTIKRDGEEGTFFPRLQDVSETTFIAAKYRYVGQDNIEGIFYPFSGMYTSAFWQESIFSLFV
jgi:hypothetical protein